MTPSYGWKAFAGFLIIITGVFNIFDGLIAVTQSGFYGKINLPVTNDIKTWGWIGMAFGVILVLAGFGILAGATWARLVGVFAVSLNAMFNIAYLNHFPFWSFTVILIDVLVIYAIVVHGGKEDEAML